MANPTVFGLQPGVRWITPEIYDWNITFERQLRADTVFHASYVGTPRSASQAGRESEPRCLYRGQLGVDSGAAALPAVQCHLPGEGERRQQLQRPCSSISRSGRRAAAGILNQITLLANYTYSKAMDYGLAENGGITDLGTSIGSGMSFYDPRQKAFETGPATYDHANRVVASFVWNLPKFTQSNAADAQCCRRLAVDRNLLLPDGRSADDSGWNRHIPDRQQH